jgi:hypothetical protein
MARPFPQPGPLVGLAYRELQQAANGTLDPAPRRHSRVAAAVGTGIFARLSCAARSGPGSTDQRRTAGQAFASDLLEEWHRYTLPSFYDRLRRRLRSHCDDSHQPWPATGRYTRYRDGADDRSRRFADDLLSNRGEDVWRTTAQLALIDLTTGEITT